MSVASFSGMTCRSSERFLRWRLAVPPEKGGWVWWIGPLIVGAMAAPGLDLSVLLVATGALAAFCLRQPLTLVMKKLRRGQGDLAPPLLWAGVYLGTITMVAAALCLAGHAEILALGAAAAPVFVWHLVLVYLGRDWHQEFLDLAAAGALALTGPAAYFVGGGSVLAAAFAIWLLTALQSCASIIHMFLRLKQRAMRAQPGLSERLRTGLKPAAAHLGALAAAGVAVHAGAASPLAVIALLLPALEGVYAVLRPQIGHTPKQLGMRQLGLSTASMLLLAFSLNGS